MAITIDNAPTGLEFSHRIGAVTITSDGTDPVRISLTAGGATLLAETFYPYDGKIELADLGELIEEYMNMTGADCLDLTLAATAGSESARADMAVLYCDIDMTGVDAANFADSHYQSTDSVHRIPRGYSPTVTWHAMSDESPTVTLHVTGYDHTTGRLIEAYCDIGTAATSPLRIEWRQVTETLEGAATTDDPHAVEVRAFSVSTDGRWQTFYIDPGLHGCTEFVYRNAFNVFESLTVPTLTATRSEAQSPCAVLNDGRKVAVTNRPQLTHETDFGPLTLGEARRVHQLARSADAYIRGTDGSLQPIVMTGGTCEYGDRLSEPVSIKLEWEYSRRRPTMPMPAGLGTFARQYNPVFA